jgi:spore maturation protein CgeB
MKILLIHPGHGHSTADVFEGLCVGFELNKVEVVRFEWGQMLRPLTSVVIGAIQSGVVKEDQADRLHQFMARLASNDAIGMMIDNEVNAIVVVNGLLFPPSTAALLKKVGIPVVCYGTEAPYFERTELEIAPFYTHWFTQERTSVGKFSPIVPTTYLPMAYNPRLHQPGPADDDKRCDLTFIGGGFPERKRLLAGVDWTDIDKTIHGTLWGLDMEAEKGRYDFERGTRYTEGAIPNEMTSAWHRSATIALNMHRKMTYIEQGGQIAAGIAESLGPRSYEIPACGGFLLSDDERPEISDVYGEAAATFKAWDSADLERQIRYWLAHPARASEPAPRRPRPSRHITGAIVPKRSWSASSIKEGLILWRPRTTETPACCCVPRWAAPMWRSTNRTGSS